MTLYSDRRGVLGGIAALIALPRAAGAGGSWADWTTRFLTPEGRVVDREQDGISHSEGQGYGLLLAQANGTRDAFDRIEAWTEANLAIRNDALLAWRWRPGQGVVAEDWHSATDGDLFRAWALLRAERDSGWAGHASKAGRIARDIAAMCLAPDPRAPAERLLKPGAESLAGPGRVLFNPSYVMPRALRELGTAFGLNDLVRAADHGETVLAELAARPALPDWISVTADGFDSPAAHARHWGYDALRIPLYLVWSGRAAHPAVARAIALFGSARSPDHVATVVSRQGHLVAESDRPGFRAVADLAACRDLAGIDRDPPDQPYYPATLQQLVRIAYREGGCGRPPPE